jgi:hypothetical protein
MMDFLQINKKKHKIFKFGFLKKDYLPINSVLGFCNPLPRPRGSGIEVGLGTSQIELFS